MKSIIESVFAEDPPAVVLGELEVATVSGEELSRAALLLEEEHYLGAARPVRHAPPQNSTSVPSTPKVTSPEWRAAMAWRRISERSVSPCTSQTFCFGPVVRSK